MKHAYPRDLIGYGQNPPHPKWPNQAKIAVQFVLNYEEGGENCVLHGDEHSETFLSEIIGAQAFPDRHLSMESMYEYGSRVGFWRLYKLFCSLQFTDYCIWRDNGTATQSRSSCCNARSKLGNCQPCYALD